MSAVVTEPGVGFSPPNVLTGLFTPSRVRTAVFVFAFAILTAISGQFTFHLSWTPVPITMQTFVVLLAGASLGWQAGAASQVLFILMGLVGLHVYANGAH